MGSISNSKTDTWFNSSSFIAKEITSSTGTIISDSSQIISVSTESESTESNILSSSLLSPPSTSFLESSSSDDNKIQSLSLSTLSDQSTTSNIDFTTTEDVLSHNYGLEASGTSTMTSPDVGSTGSIEPKASSSLYTNVSSSSIANTSSTSPRIDTLKVSTSPPDTVYSVSENFTPPPTSNTEISTESFELSQKELILNGS